MVSSVSIALSGPYEWWTNTVSLWCHNERSLSYCYQLDVSNRKTVTCDLNTACFELSKRNPIRGTPSREGSFTAQSVPAFGHLCECVWVFEREGLRVLVFSCLCAPLLSLYPIWFVLLMWFAVVLWRWILRNKCSLICFLSRWCWGSKVTRC